MHEVYGSLSGEPWVYRPWEIERLTDVQITRLLFESEAKRAEKMKEQQADAAPTVGRADRPGAVPGVLKGEEGYSSIPQTEESYVRVSMATFGGTADYWRDQFRKQGG